MKRLAAHTFDSCRIVIKSAGEMASGIAVRLHRAGFREILMLETASPMAVRRLVAFSEAVYDGHQEVEGIVAGRADSPDEIRALWRSGTIAVAVDPGWRLVSDMRPMVSVDAIIAKRNLGTRPDEAPLVVALGPGFAAGVDAHCVIETQRGHNLGRIYYEGTAEANTGIPGNIGGYTVERVLRAPVDGLIGDCLPIGAHISAGQVVCRVDGTPVASKIGGVVRGCIRPGIRVRSGMKIGDIDPRAETDHCPTVSEKARALGGAVLEAVCGFICQHQGGATRMAMAVSGVA